MFVDPLGLSVASINNAYENYIKTDRLNSYDEYESVIGDYIFINDKVLLRTFSQAQLSLYVDEMKVSKGYSPTKIGGVTLTTQQRLNLTLTYNASRSGMTGDDLYMAGAIDTIGTLSYGIPESIKIAKEITLPTPSSFKLGVGSSSNNYPTTRKALDADLKSKGYTAGEPSSGGYVVYKHPNGSAVNVKPSGEIIPTIKVQVNPSDATWNAPKYSQRVYYDGTPVPNGAHTTGHFVEPYVK